MKQTLSEPTNYYIEGLYTMSKTIERLRWFNYRNKSKDRTRIEALLQKPPTKAWRNFLIHMAKTKGWKKLGAGAFGMVFEVPEKDYVVKVFTDTSYMQWVKLCSTTLLGNQYVPKFRGKPVRLYRDREIYAVRLEKLEPFKDAFRHGSPGDKFSSDVTTAININRVLNTNIPYRVLFPSMFGQNNEYNYGELTKNTLTYYQGMITKT